LGISETASSEEIKAAYRKLSKKFHPDKNEGDVYWEDMFKKINEANSVLSNEQSRKQYDNRLRQFIAGKNTSTNDAFRTKEEELRRKEEELKRKEAEFFYGKYSKQKAATTDSNQSQSKEQKEYKKQSTAVDPLNKLKTWRLRLYLFNGILILLILLSNKTREFWSRDLINPNRSEVKSGGKESDNNKKSGSSTSKSKRSKPKEVNKVTNANQPSSINIVKNQNQNGQNKVNDLPNNVNQVKPAQNSSEQDYTNEMQSEALNPENAEDKAKWFEFKKRREEKKKKKLKDEGVIDAN
jgi:curved DNA-binding protein CbpA